MACLVVELRNGNEVEFLGNTNAYSEDNGRWGGTSVAETNVPQLKDYSQVLNLVDTKDFLMRFEHKLRMERQDPLNPEKWDKVPGQSQIMNEKGIFIMLSMIGDVINKVVGQGNLDDDMLGQKQRNRMYNKVVGDIREWLNDELFLNHEDYELDPRHFNYVRNLIKIPVSIFLTRLIGDKERKHIHGNSMGKSTRFEKYFMPGQSKQRTQVHND